MKIFAPSYEYPNLSIAITLSSVIPIPVLLPYTPFLPNNTILNMSSSSLNLGKSPSAREKSQVKLHLYFSDTVMEDNWFLVKITMASENLVGWMSKEGLWTGCKRGWKGGRKGITSP